MIVEPLVAEAIGRTVNCTLPCPLLVAGSLGGRKPSFDWSGSPLGWKVSKLHTICEPTRLYDTRTLMLAPSETSVQ